MHQLLSKLLQKRGIEDITQLDQDEKKVFDQYQKILSEETVTVNTIERFCQNQLNIIEGQFKNLNNSPQKNERLILLHSVYKSLLVTIEMPKIERESLEKYLNQLLTAE